MATESPSEPVAYEDGNSIVVCDRENPNAWIRSDVVLDAAKMEWERVTSQ